MNWTVGNLRLTDVKSVLCKNFNRPNANFTLLALVSFWLLTFTASLQKAKWRRYVRTASLLNNFRDVIWMEIEIKNNRAYCFSRSIKSLQAEKKDCPDEYHINSLLPLMDSKSSLNFWRVKLTESINLPKDWLTCPVGSPEGGLSSFSPAWGRKSRKLPGALDPSSFPSWWDILRSTVDNTICQLPSEVNSHSVSFFSSVVLHHIMVHTPSKFHHSDERSRKELHAPLRKRSSRNVEKDWILGSQV